MRTPHRWLALAGLALLVNACASAQARQPTDRPALDVPPAPPRIIEPMPLPPEPPPAPETAPEPEKPTTPPRQRPTREAVKPEPKPEVPPTELPATPTAPVAPVVPPLRTPNTASDGAEASRQVREVIDRAKRSLDGVDYRPLSNEQRELYNQAKLFLVQSEDKLKASDFELAKNYAERAEQIAKQLQKR